MMGKELEIENSLGDYRNEELWLKSEIEFTQAESVESIESKWETFWWVTLKKDWTYEVPWISEQAKNLKHKQFPEVIFGNCRLSKKLGSVLYPDSLVVPVNWSPRREIHKETFYSQKVLPWWALKIPWRHVAADGTIRDKDWYICVAANYIPKWSTIMTTLWPGKVYDTWWMKWKWIDIYVNW
jgi:hypothetical protein